MKYKKQVKQTCTSIAALLLCAGIVLSIIKSEWIWFFCLGAAVLLLLPKIFYRH